MSTSENRAYQSGRCIGCRHPSGSTCGGCGTFLDDGWNGQTNSQTPSADAPHDGLSGDGDTGCAVCGECEDADDTGHCYTCHRAAREQAATPARTDEATS